MATLLLRLAAPLQAWGGECKFETRRTMHFPTKSGVLGMIAAALGCSREEFPQKLNQLKFGVRVDDEGALLTDYHTVASEGTYITYREYLSDAIFLVGLESDDEEYLHTLENALRTPAYPLYLGRRSCPPTMPLVLGIRNCDLLTSLKNEVWQLAPWRQEKINDPSECRLRIITDSDPAEGGTALKDLPISFSMKHRQFTWRNVKDHGYIEKFPSEVSAEIESAESLKNYLPEMTEHDPMKWK